MMRTAAAVCSLAALALCVRCQQESSSGTESSASNSAQSTQPLTSSTTTFEPQDYTALDATTLSPVSLPSGVSVSAATIAPDYSGLYSSYWSGIDPAQSTAEPQPVIVNQVNNVSTYAFNETNPFSVPQKDYVDSAYLPPSKNATLANPDAQILPAGFNITSLSTAESRMIVKNATDAINTLINGSATDAASKCETCKSALSIAQNAAQQAPWEIPSMLTELCIQYKFSKNPTCPTLFAPNVEGGPATQVLYFANFTSDDAQYICNSQFKVCPKPVVSAYYPTLSDLVPTAKPSNASAPRSSGERLQVLHLSDIHIDPRYAIGSEGNCTSGLCCRELATNTDLLTTYSNASLPAPRYGSFQCDSPFDLVISAMQAIGEVTGLGEEGPHFSIFTGDSVSHDRINELDTKYAEESEDIVISLLKEYLSGKNKTKAVYPTISNHDNRYGSGWNAPRNLQPAYLQDLYDENYNHLVSMWQREGWLTSAEAEVSRSHYTSYSAKTAYGLRVIAINGNTFYPGNLYNLLNTSNADQFGQFAFLAQELESAESAGERVWIIMHQDLGWDGTNALPNPTDLMYQIVDRFSPHVIAGLFAGHTHEIQHSIFYSNNGTTMNANDAVAINFIGPSITPLTNLNSGFQMYDVDSASFEVLDQYFWFSNVTAFPAIDAPLWQFGGSYREAFGKNIAWPSNAPLNATWWHLVTEQMQNNTDLVELYQIYQSKLSQQAGNCTSAACVEAKVCYMRSGSHALAAGCPAGFGSTQDF